MQQLCRHGQGLGFCLECWREHPDVRTEEPAVVHEPARVIHFACGCRATILEGGGVGSYSDKGCEEEGHPELGRMRGNGAVMLPQSRRWLVHELLRIQTVIEHAFRERKDCALPGCERWNQREQRA